MSSLLPAASPVNDIRGLLARHQASIAQILPKVLPVEKLLKVAVNAVWRSPKLQTCSTQSLFSAIVNCGQLGLEPNTPAQQAHLVPFKGQCTLVIGYRGYIELARRSGEVGPVYADIIREFDKWELVSGLMRDLKHWPDLTLADRGKPLAYYSVYRSKDNLWGDFVVMNKKEVDAIRDRSKNKSSDGPWVTDYDAMGKKTAIKQNMKTAPLGLEVARAVAVDDKAEMGETVDYKEAFHDAGISVDGLEGVEPLKGQVQGAGEPAAAAVNPSSSVELRFDGLPPADLDAKVQDLALSIGLEDFQAYAEHIGWLKAGQGFEGLGVAEKVMMYQKPDHIRDVVLAWVAR